ncbi:unnamed protein product [Pleuronectes platessa]|uniref:EF-hand domain-containing protein n=1 Tax=Pleuronectes platessa TaxID=8262 RepID=A0A9N7Z841_PLEPL|nr:unnamed protein product [Pleuronectes platessa]
MVLQLTGPPPNWSSALLVLHLTGAHLRGFLQERTSKAEDQLGGGPDIFLVFDKNKTKRLEYQEVAPALKAAGITVDDLVMQLVGLRYTEPDMTISYPGFLYLVMKLESMIQKFQAYDVAGMGTIAVSYRRWLHLTMYN